MASSGMGHEEEGPLGKGPGPGRWPHPVARCGVEIDNHLQQAQNHSASAITTAHQQSQDELVNLHLLENNRKNSV